MSTPDPWIDGEQVLREPPPGYIVDFDNPQRTGVPEVYYLAGFGIFLSVLSMAQRLYVKLFILKRLQADDYFLILAFITSLVIQGLDLNTFVMKIEGVHIWEAPVSKLNSYLLDVYISISLFIICGTLAKIALLIFYFRLSPQKWFKWSIWATIVFIVVYTIIVFFMIIFACTPISISWDISIRDGSCLSRPALYIATAVANIVSDILLILLPIPMIIRLQLPRRQKIGLMAVFGVGSVTIVTSIVRVSILPKYVNSLDPTWDVAWVTIWAIIEANLMIICASLPTLRKFLRHVAPKLIGSSIHDSKSRKTRTAEEGQLPTRILGSTSQTRRDRHQYSQFDPEEIRHDTYVMGPVSKGSDFQVMSGQNDDSVGWGDSDSEKAIVTGGNDNSIIQTKTVTIEFSSHEQK